VVLDGADRNAGLTRDRADAHGVEAVLDDDMYQRIVQIVL
jgi:hypothetical protein